MEKKNKIILLPILVCSLILIGYLIYPDTASVSLKDTWGEFNIVTPNEIGKTVEKDGVVVTVKLPRTVKINGNITVNYTITNKRYETIYPNTYSDINHTPHKGMTPLYFEPVHPGETITFTDSYPIRHAYDDVNRPDTDFPSNATVTRVFHPFHVWILKIYFDDANNNTYFGIGEDNRVAYNSVWGGVFW